MEIDQIKSDIVSAFKAFDPEKIILFGSAARKEGDHHSDIDLIIVFRTDKRFLDRLRDLYMAWNIPKAVDILAYTPEEFARLAVESAFVRSVLEEGELIYERQ